MPPKLVKPDPTVYHKLSRDAKVYIEARAADGKWYEQHAVIPKGSVILMPDAISQEK